MNFNENERIVLTEALSDLLIYLQESAAHLSPAAAENLTANTLAIASAKIKLQKISKEKEQQFSLQELKVMYWAVKDLRDDTRDYLDSLSQTDPERNDAIDTEKICNRFLREIRKQFADNGIDIQALFSDHQS